MSYIGKSKKILQEHFYTCLSSECAVAMCFLFGTEGSPLETGSLPHNSTGDEMKFLIDLLDSRYAKKDDLKSYAEKTGKIQLS